jgi:hypothetical protein
MSGGGYRREQEGAKEAVGGMPLDLILVIKQIACNFSVLIFPKNISASSRSPRLKTTLIIRVLYRIGQEDMSYISLATLRVLLFFAVKKQPSSEE